MLQVQYYANLYFTTQKISYDLLIQPHNGVENPLDYVLLLLINREAVFCQ